AIERRQVRFDITAAAIGKPGGEQGVTQARLLRYADTATIEQGTGAAVGGKQFILDRVVDHAMFDHTVDLYGYGYAEMRDAVNEIRGAVNGVDNPHRVRLARGARFLGYDGVIGMGAADGFDNVGFGAFVDFGDIIVFA